MSYHSVADIDGFIDMIHAACDDRQMKQTLQSLLSLPNPDRREMIRGLVNKLESEQAPAHLIEAVACLVSDDIALATSKALSESSTNTIT